MNAVVVNTPAQPPECQAFDDCTPQEDEGLVQVRPAGLHPVVKSIALLNRISACFPVLFDLAAKGTLTINVQPVPLSRVEEARNSAEKGRRIVFTV
jgi:hypothetical protein